MRFIHSNKQYIERTMYPINPYMNASEAPLTMEAFVAPANFDPDAQELNIVKAFAAYPDVNKKYIFSVGTSATTVLPVVGGRSYAYSENGGAYTTIVSGTVTWTVGSTKRNVVVIDSAVSVIAAIPVGGIWAFASDKVYSFSSSGNTFLKYLHCQIINQVTTIANYAFNGCSGLTGSLTIPNSVTSISDYAFSRCSGLTGSLVIPNSVSSVGISAFERCSGLTGSLTIPNSVTSVGISAFESCSGFTGSLTIPNLVTSISDYAFYNCSKLTGSLTIPNQVTSIGSAAFYNCSKLIGSLTIPNQVTTIANYAFSGCSGLTGTLTIPNSVTSISDYAFYGCSGILMIDCYKLIPIPIFIYSFGLINKTTCVLHVPVGSLAAYQAAPYWNEFTNIIDDL